MEEGRPYASEQVLRQRNVPDVPEDVDFVMEHLNDPNFNLSRPPSFISVVEKRSTKKFDEDGEAESHFESDRYSTSRAESRNSTAIDFDESVILIIYDSPFFLTTCHSESPYPEVRAAVSSVDDPLMPVNTFRMWFLGILFVLITSGLNQVFAMRCMLLSQHAYNI